MSRLEKNMVFQRFYALVDSIPKGRVGTYGQIAREAGLPRHARHVGHALRALPSGSKLPWHRVLNARGEISQRDSEGYRTHRARLVADGVEVSSEGRVNLRRYGWDPDA